MKINSKLVFQLVFWCCFLSSKLHWKSLETSPAFCLQTWWWWWWWWFTIFPKGRSLFLEQIPFSLVIPRIRPSLTKTLDWSIFLCRKGKLVKRSFVCHLLNPEFWFNKSLMLQVTMVKITLPETNSQETHFFQKMAFYLPQKGSRRFPARIHRLPVPSLFSFFSVTAVVSGSTGRPCWPNEDQLVGWSDDQLAKFGPNRLPEGG